MQNWFSYCLFVLIIKSKTLLKNIILPLIFIYILSPQAYAQDVKWLSWEEAMELSKTEKRKIMVDVYTDWCGWCKQMEKVTFNSPSVAGYLNDNYYPVKFDAEVKKTLTYNGKEYKFIKRGRNGYHELAAELLRGKLSFPTVVFLDEDAKMIQPIPGFIDAKTFQMIMKYFAENHFKNIPWPKYMREFQPAVTPQPVKNP